MASYSLREIVYYCPQCNILTLGFLKEHYCEGTIELGSLGDTYVDLLERKIDQLEITTMIYEAKAILWDIHSPKLKKKWRKIK